MFTWRRFWRHHRFEETIAVQNYLLENQMLDEANGYGLRLGRAMAMLREDHLVDADRAMGIFGVQRQ